MTDTRTPRDKTNRESTARKRSWSPPSLLPDPDPDENWVYRYVRASTLGVADLKNLSSKLREGWEICPAAEAPGISGVIPDVDSRFGKDNVEIGGLILCRAPKELKQAKRAYLDEKNRQQLASVDSNLMRESDSRMPIFKEKRTRISTDPSDKG
jgi:hypothetical protein